MTRNAEIRRATDRRWAVALAVLGLSVSGCQEGRDSSAGEETAPTGLTDSSALPAPPSIPPPTPTSPSDQSVDPDVFTAREVSACEERLHGPQGLDIGVGEAVYFVCESGGTTSPARAMPMSDSDPLEALVAAALAGPTAEETDAGFLSVFNDQSADVAFSARLVGSKAVIDLDPAIREVPLALIGVSGIASLVATVGQLDGVERVLVLVDGASFCEPEC